MFLDETYFKGELYLPNLRFKEKAVGMAIADQITGEKNLEYFVKKYEVRYLQEALGCELTKAFITGIESGDEFWNDLYAHLYFEEMGIKFSPAANYVYFHIMRDNRVQNTMFGLVRQQSDRSKVVEDGDKLILIWNDMVHQTMVAHDFLRSNWDKYKPYAKGWNCACSEVTHPINSFGI